MKGTLLLLPCHMGDSNADMAAVPALLELIHSTEHFIVENVKTARRWLRTLDREIPIDPLTFHTLNKHTSPHDLEGFLNVAKQGGTVALLSEAGLPCIADPGAQVVEIAHRLNIKVVPIPGPSSILLALVASGLNGQNFCFHGYLAKDQGERIRQIKELEAIRGGKLKSLWRRHFVLNMYLPICLTNAKRARACA